MQSIWRKHLIICLFLGLLAIPIYFLDLAFTEEGGGNWDHTGFPRAYLLDLHHIARHRCRLNFNWRRIISQVRSIAHSLLVNGASRDSARRMLCLLRKAVARRGHLQLTANSLKRWCYFARGVYEERRGWESNPRIDSL